MIEIINPIDDKKWLNFIEHQEKATIFHHPAWLSVLNKQYHFPVFAICSQDKARNITAGIPFCEVMTLTGRKKWISLPFSDFCNPLYSDLDDLKSIIDSIIKEKNEKRIDSIEIRYELPFPSGFRESNEFVIHSKELKGTSKEIFKTLKKTRAQQPIQKSIREGLIVEVRFDDQTIKNFYDLHLKTRKKLGVPIQPKNYFRHFYKEIIENNLGFIVIVKRISKIVSAGIFAGFGDTLTYKYSASDPDYLKLRPNNLMLWTAMREAVNKGFLFFDFGKSDIDNTGLRKFKTGWGTEEKELIYSYYPEVPESGFSGKVQSKFLKPLIQNSPSFICRMLGELFYKNSV